MFKEFLSILKFWKGSNSLVHFKYVQYTCLIMPSSVKHMKYKIAAFEAFFANIVDNVEGNGF